MTKLLFALLAFSYPGDCRTPHGCAEIPCHKVQKTKRGYELPHGLFIGHWAAGIRASTDGRCHVCLNSLGVKCLLLPIGREA